MKKSQFGFSVFLFFSFLVIWLALSVIEGLAGFSSTALALNFAPQDNPEYNLDKRGYDPTGGQQNLFTFPHPVNRAPWLCGLVEGDARPGVTSLFKIHQYDFTNNHPLPDYETISENPSDYASVVGFSTSKSPTKNILVPYAPGIDIGLGRQVTVYYASTDQIFIMYNSSIGITNGYGIHIKNLNVRPKLLALYNKLISEGNNQLPALYATDILGTATGDILVSIRDTGQFMDPRWDNDWWAPCNTPAKASSRDPGTIETSPPPPQWPSSTVCYPSTSGDRTSRPIPFEACNQTGKLTTSCAKSFSITDVLKYGSCDQDTENPCTDVCAGSTNCYPLTKSWTGTVSINSANIQIPFVGKKTDVILPGLGGLTPINESEDKYLADYFDGTNEYYYNYRNYTQDYFNRAGVLRKLTPSTYQDTLKTNMIRRAGASLVGTIVEGKIHNYEIAYPTRICWSLPFAGSLANNFAKDLIINFYKKIGIPVIIPPDTQHLCLYRNNDIEGVLIVAAKAYFDWYNGMAIGKMFPIAVDYYDAGNQPKATLNQMASKLPPALDDPDYNTKWEAWKNTSWGHLWEAVPMVTREDTEGQIVPYLGSKPLDTLEIDADNQKNQIEKVPHVARLYEASKLVNQILMPYGDPITPVPIKKTTDAGNATKTLLASTEVLAATTSPNSFHLEGNASLAGPNKVNVDIAFVSEGPAGCDGGIQLYLPPGSNNMLINNLWIKSVNGSRFNVPPLHTGSPFTVNSGETKVVSWEGSLWRTNGDSACISKKTLTCSFRIDAGVLITDCGGGVVTPPSCVWGDPLAVDKCVKSDAITDSNPNDKICCDNDKPIEAKVTAWEQFNNVDYSCGGWYCQVHPDDPAYPTTDIPVNSCDECNSGNYPPPNYYIEKCFWKDGTGGSGGKQLTKPVSREVGIALYHPYLSEIYKMTSGPTGTFNMFRPSTYPKFPDTPAYSKEEVQYFYTSNSTPGRQPTSGKFYFPYLGGIQQAKQWTTDALFPSSKK